MEKTLVVLAAGMGSRFGGLKQLEPVGPSNEFLIDYSVYDAKRAGFTKVVFVIKKENKEAFEETISQRINGIEVEYAYQEMENIPLNIKIDRVKPLGTAHALYCAKDKVKGPFGLISADDFYGNESFEILSNYLDNNEGICVVGYPIGATLSDEGEVKRGVVLSNNNKIEKISSACAFIAFKEFTNMISEDYGIEYDELVKKGEEIWNQYGQIWVAFM